MVIPIKKEHSNLTLKSPSNWNANKYGKCNDLHISNYDGIMYSYHKPTWKEKVKILLGGHIRLCVRSDSHPPIAIDCEH